MVEQLPVELLQLGTGLDAELLDQHPSRLLIQREGIRLPAAAVEGEHQLPARALAERMVTHDRVQFRHDLAVAAPCKLGLDPPLERDCAQLVEPRDLAANPRLLLELGQCAAAPERERLVQHLPAVLLEQGFEA